MQTENLRRTSEVEAEKAMDSLQSVRGTVHQKMGLIKKSFENVLAGFKSNEEELKGVRESIAQSSKELDLRREQVKKKEEELKEIQFVQEKELLESETRKKEVGLILENVKVREENLAVQEKRVAERVEEIELEKRKLESIQKSIDEKSEEISRREKQVEEKSEKFELEIGQREKFLTFREERVCAKEKELEARERMLIQKRTGEFGLPNADATGEPGELRSKSRKRRRTNTDIDFVDQVNEVSSSDEPSCYRTIMISKSSELGSHSGNSYSHCANSSSGDSVCDFPDPEFNDFENLRKGFAVNQLWAIYDKVDVMPRNYAQIMKKDNQGLCISWLEVDSRYEEEINSHGFPVACGRFKRGMLKENVDRLIFSHQIHYEKYGWLTSCYLIYPRKGEIWALFKDWKTVNRLNSATSKKYSYEIVEVLSDFVEGRGLRVVYLDKIRGFVSLFQRAFPNVMFRISAREMFRFSHQIPSYQMNGTEGQGVPKGSFELDTAAIPLVLCDKGGER